MSANRFVSSNPRITVSELIADHEAGHALIAHLLGGKVKQVTIDPDNDDGPERQGDAQIRRQQSCNSRQSPASFNPESRPRPAW